MVPTSNGAQPGWIAAAAAGLIAAALDLAVGFLAGAEGLESGRPLAATVTTGVLLFLALGFAIDGALHWTGLGSWREGRLRAFALSALPGFALGFTLANAVFEWSATGWLEPARARLRHGGNVSSRYCRGLHW